jgi:hypothetical protein
MHDFIGRHLDALQICGSLSQEDMQMALLRTYLEEHIHFWQIHVTVKVAELVFNLDELLASADVAKEDVYHAVSRRHRHVTLLPCVSATTETLTPLLITASPIPDTLQSRGLTQDEDAMIRQRPPADMTEELCYKYISNVFIPYVMAVRDRTRFQNEMALLLMDSAFLNTSERFRWIFGENHITAITFPAHTTNLFQAVDLVLFGVLKKLKASATGEFDDDLVNAQISELIQAYEQTAASSTIRESF